MGADSLLVYSVSHPNMSVGPRDSCTTMYTVYSYFFWVKNGKHWFRKVDGKCESKQLPAKSKVIQFAMDNYSRIKDEFFMGATYVREWKGKLRVTETTVDHEPKYSILIVIGDKYKYLRFTQIGLESKESLFTDYNKQLVSFKLFELIESEIAGN